MLTHNNVVSNVRACNDKAPIDPGASDALSFLPCCHILERMLLYTYQYHGTSIHFAESLETILENLHEVRPHVMSVVPRLMEKMYDAIIAEGSKLPAIKRASFLSGRWNLAKNTNRMAPMVPRYERKLALARKLVFSKWRAGFGGNGWTTSLPLAVRHLQPRLIRIFNAAGIHVMEGYGLTETAPVVTSSVNGRQWRIPQLAP